MPVWLGDGAEAARATPGPDEQITPGFNPTLKYGAVFGGFGVGYDSQNLPPRREMPLFTVVRTTGLTNRRPGENDTHGGGGLESGASGSSEPPVEHGRAWSTQRPSTHLVSLKVVMEHLKVTVKV